MYMSIISLQKIQFKSWLKKFFKKEKMFFRVMYIKQLYKFIRYFLNMNLYVLIINLGVYMWILFEDFIR